MTEDAASRVVLVTGLSGAGKASVLHALEDLGYEAVDNLPFALLENMLNRSHPDQPLRVAVGVDVRSRGFDAADLVGMVDRLRRDSGMRIDLVYCTADEGVLLRRFTETRRRHPLAPQGRVIDGISAERALTAPLKDAADFVNDTSERSLAALRQWIDSNFGPGDGEATARALSVSLVSFGYPNGLPREADLVFDVRFLRNPHYDPVLRPLTGRDPSVAAYVLADPDYEIFFHRVTDLLDLLLPRFVQEGKKYVTIAIGCTGGRHRSVTSVERLARYLKAASWRVSITHREIAAEHPVRDEASVDPIGSAP
ncbi:MAG: RNase adapter RapZ [Acetobacteraceae bacterium]|nr:RNase adapter RapZ [Acetobacteraceae bacterium]